MKSQAELGFILFSESLHKYSKGAPVKAFIPTPVNPDSMI